MNSEEAIKALQNKKSIRCTSTPYLVEDEGWLILEHGKLRFDDDHRGFPEEEASELLSGLGTWESKEIEEDEVDEDE